MNSYFVTVNHLNIRVVTTIISISNKVFSLIYSLDTKVERDINNSP